MKIKPLFDRIAICEEKEEQTESGIFLGKHETEGIKTGKVLFVPTGEENADGKKLVLQVKEGDTVELCGMKWKVLITPGHTKGSMCLYLPASENGGERGILFSGDTLFCGAFGRTDFPGGSMNEMVKSLKRLDTLPSDTLVFPGHMQFTEIGEEQRGILRRMG